MEARVERLGDAELMGRVKAGDREAFARLVDRYKDAMVNYLSRLTGSRARAEDLAQETFLRLYENRDRYREEGRFSAFLYRIATNLARSEIRREQRRRMLKLVFRPGGNGAGPVENPQSRLLGKEAHRKLAEAIARIPIRFRIPLVLHEIEGRSYLDVAETIGCREGTVKSRISRGRKRLKEELSPYFSGGVP
jgi:RNA polymerase sigma-70 factor (ECF subfamily)